MEMYECNTLYRVCSKEDNARIEKGLPIISKAEMFPKKAVDVSFSTCVAMGSRICTLFIPTTTSQRVALDHLMSSDHGEDNYLLVIDAEKLFYSGYVNDIHFSSELVNSTNIRAKAFGLASQEVDFKGSIPLEYCILIQKRELLAKIKAIIDEALALCKTKKNPARAWTQWNYEHPQKDIQIQALNLLIAEKASLTA